MSSPRSPHTFFVGCYTKESGGQGDGIVRVRRDPDTGALRSAVTVAGTPSPSFLLRHPTLPVLYAVNELDEGTVSAFAVLAHDDLAPLGTWPTGGAFPCHLSLAGSTLLAANYGSGSVASFALDEGGVPTHRADLVIHSGRGVDPDRQEGPHAHTVAPVDGGVLAVDLGVDTVFFYRLDPATGLLGEGEIAFRTRPGSGPRHLARSGNRLYLVGELSATVTSYDDGPDGWRELGSVSTSALPGAQPSEIAVSGGFLYVANRGPDTISVFALPPSGEVPVLVGEVSTGGTWPRHFVIDGGYLYVANERSNSVVVFRIDPTTGLPTPTGDVLATPSPTCVVGFLAEN